MSSQLEVNFNKNSHRILYTLQGLIAIATLQLPTAVNPNF